jgi:hypothetical protein
MHPVDFTNDPYLAGKNDNLHAINATMQIDFMGQCGSESLGFALLGHRRSVGLRSCCQSLKRWQGLHRPAVNGQG